MTNNPEKEILDDEGRTLLQQLIWSAINALLYSSFL